MDHGAGFQPCMFLLDVGPGPSAQAGMERAVGAFFLVLGVTWCPLLQMIFDAILQRVFCDDANLRSPPEGQRPDLIPA